MEWGQGLRGDVQEFLPMRLPSFGEFEDGLADAAQVGGVIEGVTGGLEWWGVYPSGT